LTTDAILDEVACEKFGWPGEEIKPAIEQTSRFADHVEPTQQIDVVMEDPTDNRIIECAVVGKSEYLVTGDNDVLKVRQYGGTKIVSLRIFLRIQEKASMSH
jgi:predicted nucleic acid-binding protein